MPVESNSRGIYTDDLEEESTNQREGETSGLLGSGDSTMGFTMQSTNGEGGGGGGREGQLLVDDIVSAEGNDEEYTKETNSDGESDQFSGIFPGRIGEKTERIHGGNGGNKYDAETTGGC